MVLKVNAGLFFRAEGGAAAAFGSNQGEGLPNITGSITSNALGVRESASVSGAIYNGDYTLYAAQQTDRPNLYKNLNIQFNASRSSAIYGASTHVTPVNSTIRVWKRTA